ncbi:hypothetical protein DES40_2367 [Litorimonas taeanensis]|uniref:Uncharacterized protein n=1 Tax=Litorimonas taeanensis TaxID=568099 RepID=A0A420WF04_9PROT|nr:hypothetical protein [Litorimonas taeanensis]RKQ69566.1 hypothetical protein DES40_2367 [Litorimonas taeanensis]
MKKAVIALIVVLFVLVVGFSFFLTQASPDNAPQEVSITELPDTYEK